MRMTDADYDRWLSEPYEAAYAREEQFDHLVHRWAEMVKDEHLSCVWDALDLLANDKLRVGSFDWKVRSMLQAYLEAELSDPQYVMDEAEYLAALEGAMPPYEAFAKAVAAMRDGIEDDDYFRDTMEDIERDLDRNPEVD